MQVSAKWCRNFAMHGTWNSERWNIQFDLLVRNMNQSIYKCGNNSDAVCVFCCHHIFYFGLFEDLSSERDHDLSWCCSLKGD